MGSGTLFVKMLVHDHLSGIEVGGDHGANASKPADELG